MDSETTPPPRDRSRWFLIAPPPSNASLSAPQRLVHRLTSHFSASGIVVLAAPAGYGKTALLRDFATEFAVPSAWLTLTRHDRDDEESILLGVLASIDQQVAPGRPVRSLYDRIAQAVAGIPDGLVLIIDDAHHAGPILGEIVEALSNATGRRVRFAVAGRPEVSAWFVEQIALDSAVLVDAGDLAMNVDEVKATAARLGHPMGHADAERATEAAGGWPIAVHLSLASEARGQSGSDALFVDFVEVSVLGGLAPDLRAFVLETTTCTALSTRLAAALTGRKDAADMFDRCRREGLPLVRVSAASSAAAYRWNEVFADACRRILERIDPVQAARLHQKAAHELTAGHPEEALRHAVRADDELALSIMRATWVRILVESGARALLESCAALTAQQLEHPEILAIRACCLDLIGDQEGARILARAAATAGGGDPSFLVTYTFVQLFVLDDHRELARAVDQARRLLVDGVFGSTVDGYRLFVVGWTLLRLRTDPIGAANLLQTALSEARLTSCPVLERRAASNLLFALTFAGRFADADTVLDDRITADHVDDDWGAYDGGIGLFAFGYGEYWRGRLGEAERAFTALIAHGGHRTSYAALGRVFLVFIAAASGRLHTYADAENYTEAIGDTQAHGVPWHIYRALAHAQLAAARGEASKALELIESFADAPNVPVVRVLAADIARRLSADGLAVRLLAGLTASDRVISYVTAAAETTAALVAYRAQEVDVARRHLEDALDIGAREGITPGAGLSDPDLVALLAAHLAGGTHHGESIAARLAELQAASTSLLGAALSDREREVLHYLRTPMTANEIAAELFVSVSTIRTHLRSIYRKLGVSGRREAARMRL